MHLINQFGGLSSFLDVREGALWQPGLAVPFEPTLLRRIADLGRSPEASSAGLDAPRDRTIPTLWDTNGGWR